MSGSDAELVEQVRAGEREAYGELVRRYQGHVYGLAYSLVDDWAEAQDIAQETFVRAYCHLGDLREAGRFAAWLRRVAVGVAVGWLRAYRPARLEQLGGPADLEAMELPDFAPGPPEVLEKKELAEVVQRVIASLPPKYRVPLTMFHLDGLSYEKVAGFLDIPLGTAKSLIHRARAKLKGALGSYYSEEVAPTVQEVFNEHKLQPEFAQRVLRAAGVFDQTFAETWARYYQARSVELMRLVCLRAAGRTDVDYETLVALSGFGTSFAYHPQHYFLYSPPEPPGVSDDRVARATGQGWEWLPRWKSAEEAWQTLKQTIDAGQPIEGNFADELLFGGYQEAARPEDRKVYAMGGFDAPSWWPWERFVEWANGGPEFWTFGRLAASVPRAPAREIALEVMQGLVQFARHDGRAEVGFMKEGVFGFAGLEAFASDVADVGKDPEAWDPGWLGCHCVNRQATGRRCMAVYLRDAATLFPAEAAARLTTAADAYDGAWAAWQDFSRHLGNSVLVDTPGPEGSTLEEVKLAWRDPRRRRAGAAAIRRALRYERKAAAEVGRALRLLGAAPRQRRKT